MGWNCSAPQNKLCPAWRVLPVAAPAENRPEVPNPACHFGRPAVGHRVATGRVDRERRRARPSRCRRRDVGPTVASWRTSFLFHPPSLTHRQIHAYARAGGGRGEREKEERELLFSMWISRKHLSPFFLLLSPSFTPRRVLHPKLLSPFTPCFTPRYPEATDWPTCRCAGVDLPSPASPWRCHLAVRAC